MRVHFLAPHFFVLFSPNFFIRQVGEVNFNLVGQLFILFICRVIESFEVILVFFILMLIVNVVVFYFVVVFFYLLFSGNSLIVV